MHTATLYHLRTRHLRLVFGSQTEAREGGRVFSQTSGIDLSWSGASAGCRSCSASGPWDKHYEEDSDDELIRGFPEVLQRTPAELNAEVNHEMDAIRQIIEAQGVPGRRYVTAFASTPTTQPNQFQQFYEEATQRNDAADAASLAGGTLAWSSRDETDVRRDLEEARVRAMTEVGRPNRNEDIFLPESLRGLRIPRIVRTEEQVAAAQDYNIHEIMGVEPMQNASLEFHRVHQNVPPVSERADEGPQRLYWRDLVDMEDSVLRRVFPPRRLSDAEVPALEAGNE